MLAVLDVEVMDELKYILADDFSRVIALFITDSESKIQQIEAHIARAAFNGAVIADTVTDRTVSQDLHGVVHSLKGSSAHIGAKQLQECCIQLEQSTKRGDWPGINADFAALKSAYLNVKLQLQII